MLNLKPKQLLLWPYVKEINRFTLNPNGFSSMTVVPTGNIFLSIFWGSGQYISKRPSTTELATRGGINISGQQFEIANLWVTEGEVSVIGFELTPHAIYQFFGVPQNYLTNLILPLEDIWGNSALQLYQHVVDEPDPFKQIAMVEQFLCERITSQTWKKNQSIDEAISIIKHLNGNVPVKILSEQLRMSPRTLERNFFIALGISPKSYCKVMQFNHAFKQIVLHKKSVLDVVTDGGYYDQAHFIHHFHKVFGVCPGQFFDEYEKFLEYFSKDNDDCALNSMSDTLQGAGKFFVF